MSQDQKNIDYIILTLTCEFTFRTLIIYITELFYHGEQMKQPLIEVNVWYMKNEYLRHKHLTQLVYILIDCYICFLYHAITSEYSHKAYEENHRWECGVFTSPVSARGRTWWSAAWRNSSKEWSGICSYIWLHRHITYTALETCSSVLNCERDSLVLHCSASLLARGLQ